MYSFPISYHLLTKEMMAQPPGFYTVFSLALPDCSGRKYYTP